MRHAKHFLKLRIPILSLQKFFGVTGISYCDKTNWNPPLQSFTVLSRKTPNSEQKLFGSVDMWSQILIRFCTVFYRPKPRPT